MKRTAPMKRSGFARWTPKPAKQMDYQPRPRAPALRTHDDKARMTVAMPKQPSVRSKPLREACRVLACQHCGANDGTVVAAHSNWSVHGKAKARKADDTRVASLCCVCHSAIDQGSHLSRAERQALWWGAHVSTVRLLVSLSLWPASIAVPDVEINPFEVNQ